jgi:purine-binding chemotaxis protein CheW
LLSACVPPSEHLTSYLRARLGDAILGLPSSAVREIVRAVAITPVPGAPAIIEGAVNVRGQIVPVVDVRARLGLEARPLDPDQFLVFVDAGTRRIALRVDEVDDLVEIDAGVVGSSEALSPALRGVAGLAARPDGVLVIYDVDLFISHAEGESLDATLAALR